MRFCYSSIARECRVLVSLLELWQKVREKRTHTLCRPRSESRGASEANPLLIRLRLDSSASLGMTNGLYCFPRGFVATLLRGNAAFLFCHCEGAQHARPRQSYATEWIARTRIASLMLAMTVKGAMTKRAQRHEKGNAESVRRRRYGINAETGRHNFDIFTGIP